MASVCTPDCDVDYSIVDGRVRSFTYKGVEIYDEDGGAHEGWKDHLVSFVLDYRLNKDDGRGLHAFVYRMIDEGLVSYERTQ
jgi:hypothetical protein